MAKEVKKEAPAKKPVAKKPAPAKKPVKKIMTQYYVTKKAVNLLLF